MLNGDGPASWTKVGRDQDFLLSEGDEDEGSNVHAHDGLLLRRFVAHGGDG